jgi:hypothetical protein
MKQAESPACSFFGLLLVPEDGTGAFLRNLGLFSTDYMYDIIPQKTEVF